MTGARFPTIDIHAHYFPRAYLDLIGEEGASYGARLREDGGAGPVVEAGGLRAGPLPAAFTDLERRLADMDATGVDVQVLSLTQPMVYWAGGGLGERLSAAFNDSLATAHEAHPGRFVGCMTLPMQDPPRAVRELERAARLPGVRGVYLATAICGRELSDEAFWPVYERIADLGLPVFLHPLGWPLTVVSSTARLGGPGSGAAARAATSSPVAPAPG